MPAGANHYVTTAAIDAMPDVVWNILTRAEGYRDWNPEIIAVDGCFALNQKIKVSVRLANGATRRLGLNVTTYEPASQMTWTGG